MSISISISIFLDGRVLTIQKVLVPSLGLVEVM